MIIPAERAFVPVRNPEVSHADIDGAAVLYDTRHGSVTRLDPVGSVVWRCIDDTSTIDELAADLAAGFSTDPELVRADVLKLTERLQAAALLLPVHPPQGAPSSSGSAAATPDPFPRILTDPPSP